jgi:transporter family protein
MPEWMLFALVTLVLWAITGVTQKLSTDNISVEHSLLWFALAFVPIAAFIMLTQPLDWNITASAWFFAILGGLLNGLGAITSFAAYRHGGKAAIVTPLIALFPVVTVALALPLLHEEITAREWCGIALAIAAAFALSYEGKSNA